MANRPGFASRLRDLAEVIVRVGLNLQPGQRLLLAEPYDLQGVARSAEDLVSAVKAVAATDIDVIWGDGVRLRELAEKRDWRGFARLTGANAAQMDHHIRNGDALLFLQGSQPRLLEGIPAGVVAELQRIGWEYFGPVAQQLMQGATNWTVAPAPSPAWAEAAYNDLPAEQRLHALWEDVFAALRIPVGSGASGHDLSLETPAPALAAWQTHLAALARQRDDLNARRLKVLRYQGDDTDLSVILPEAHVWCTAQLTSKTGVAFVANLPTEEIFTAPHRNSAAGVVRVSRPVSYGGALIDGIELEFKRGLVVQAKARTGRDLLQRLLETDDGARRIGEVALVGPKKPVMPATPASPRLFHHALLDENASHHVALGEAYGFCLPSPDRSPLNRSLIHLDLPVGARVLLPGVEPT